ncbi:NAD(P)-dependent oxidoreductase [Pseudoduganella sp. SL102]|uniref:NAD-dependent epimerase/dehydratase family protein n=1 Tax=Pseudoduganella sp. SL102 TaxID=2995154 RepID=UPI00248AF92C|nr:NAD(P)-dependent oxidoreductase [Pseudoduganella sp. SL102]WBS02780.1 NAD(P)-dependent oxidoreductase [Pseudoduganella sp. SL102]
MMGDSILLTGATGFIGSHVARRLVADGWQVHAVVRDPAAVLPEGVAGLVHDGTTAGMTDLMHKASPRVVVHLASLFLAQHCPADIVPLLQSNVVFGAQLAEAMQVTGVRHLVNAGTSWQYFHSEKYRPVCLYAATKEAFEALLRFYVDSAGLQVITLKLFDTYGPGDPRPKLMHLLKNAAREKTALSMSPGEQLIDLVYIDDVVDAFLVAITRLLAGVVGGMEEYGVSSGAPLTLRALAERFSKISNLPLAIDWGGRPYRPREVMTPWQDYRLLPGWKPKVDIDQGIAAFLDKTQS